MNEQPIISYPEQPKVKRSHKTFKVLISFILILAALAGTAYLVYTWQQIEANKQQQTLENTISKLIQDKKQQPNPDANATDEFTYISKTGGLTLTLPVSYAVIVSVDGNKGGSPGASIKVGKKDTQNTITDDQRGSVSVEIDAFSQSIDANANELQNDLKEKGYSDIKISDTTVGTQASKLIQATPPPVGGAGIKKIYVVKSGSYFYTITATGSSQPGPDILNAVLAGVKIESKTN